MRAPSERGVLSRWLEWWQASELMKRNQRWAADARLVLLTFLNALSYWPWHWLRVAFDAGDHHPNLAFGLLLLTLWLWYQLVMAVVDRFIG
jgi:hypothetical protein